LGGDGGLCSSNCLCRQSKVHELCYHNKALQVTKQSLGDLIEFIHVDHLFNVICFYFLVTLYFSLIRIINQLI